ncbi:bifunctional 2-polyprenyl-6-hydroxyphenol methylase/3-demethylubiquinol 3-O-methyltransferase UbiG [Rhodobacter sp. CZR27]|uniref:class I SAM-dependent methyltransferase n=1 Tax=Rhodobacter sp. CZR27 TaxID=2033869 RepID=UPI000BBECC05|nr:methyltransferase domain-containing protein [Rhodobacter sp. CZR27]
MGNYAMPQKLRDALKQKGEVGGRIGNALDTAARLASDLWKGMRTRALSAASPEANDRLYDVHKEWLGDLSGKKVLELGGGSPLSGWLAATARTYHVVDADPARLEALKPVLGEGRNARLIEADVMSGSFREGGYDVIYLHSVLHRLADRGPLLDRLLKKLAIEGRIVTTDPAEGGPLTRLLRRIDRPFRADATPDFPVTEEVKRELSERFYLIGCVTPFRRAKAAMALGVIHPDLGRSLAERLMEADLKDRAAFGRLRSALQVSFLLGAPD